MHGWKWQDSCNRPRRGQGTGIVWLRTLGAEGMHCRPRLACCSTVAQVMAALETEAEVAARGYMEVGGACVSPCWCLGLSSNETHRVDRLHRQAVGHAAGV